MRSLRLWFVGLSLLALPLSPVTAASSSSTATLRSDGFCFITNDAVELRAKLQDQLRAWQRYKLREEGKEDVADNKPPPPNGTPAKEAGPEPLSDAALEKLIRQMYADQSESPYNRGPTNTLETVEIRTNSVRIVRVTSFSNPADFLQSAHLFWSSAGIHFDNSRLEQDTNGHLRFTLLPYPQRARESVRTAWKRRGVEGQLRLVFPGKVLTSAFPNTRDNATWLDLDVNNEEALKAASRMSETSTVFVAELAGLKLEKPLDAKKLLRAVRSRGVDDELPITDSGPGFIAEAQSVTVFTHYFFTNGQAELNRTGQRLPNTPGLSIQGKLYAPKGRTLIGLSAVQVLQAADDRGRPLLGSNQDTDEPETDHAMSITAGNSPASSLIFMLRLPTPPADVESLNEVTCETIATTSGDWKEMTLTNFNVTSTNEIDLGSILPGARVVFSKISRKNRQLELQGKILGPPAIRRIEFRAMWSETDRGQAYFNDRNFKSAGAQSVREFQGQAYSYQGNADDSAPLTVLLRFPLDLRRERVRFSLTGLDLF